MYYLGKSKGVLPLADDIKQSSVGPNGLNGPTVVILDEVVLARLASDPEFRHSLRDPHHTIVAPVGWVGGVKPFNAPNLSEVTERVGAVVRDSGIQRGDSVETVERRIEATLKGYVEHELARVALVDTQCAGTVRNRWSRARGLKV